MRKSVRLADLPKFCHDILANFGQKQLILLEGPLGAGKTAFVGECVKQLGGQDSDSPTFSIINEYNCSVPVYHVDLYRLESEEEIESTGFWDLFDNERGYIFVEWSEKVQAGEWPSSWPRTKISIGYTDETDERLFTIESLS